MKAGNTAEFYALIKDIEIAMLTTRRRDGRLVSRPMATQAEAAGADLWFVTSEDAGVIDELEHDAHVNLAYFNQKSREYVSASGIAQTSRDREKIHELYRPDWKIWFGGESERAGTADDPRMVLIAVDVESAVYVKIDKPRPVVLFDMVKGMLTGEAADIAETKHVSGRDIPHH